MQIIHTIASLSPANGGTSVAVIELSAALVRAGVCTAVWTPAGQQPEWTARLSASGVEVLAGPIANCLSGRGSDLVVHDHGIWLPVNHRVARFTVGADIPRVVSPRGMLEPWALKHRGWKKRLAWGLYQRRDLTQASALHATAQSESTQLRCLGFRQPIFVIPNGIGASDGDSLEAKYSERNGAHASNGGTSEPERTALFLSRIHPKKGLPMLVEAWSRVRPRGWRMAVVGPDENGHQAEVAAMVVGKGLTDVWRFHEQVTGQEKWQLLADADLMILPTYSENFGNVVPEALCMETPVITTTGAPWAALTEHKCGWSVEPTVDGLEQALRAASSCSSETLREMGRRGRAWAAREFAWPGIAARMMAAYEAILSGRTTPDFV